MWLTTSQMNPCTPTNDLTTPFPVSYLSPHRIIPLVTLFLPGTTAISVLFRGKTMFVSNVGDSRAIVISQQEDGRLLAKPMSSDQTPYRRDERERVKKFGARVLSMDQIEGEPTRVTVVTDLTVSALGRN